MDSSPNICAIEAKWLAACAALAAGEYFGFVSQDISASWPAFLAATIIFSLIGFGLPIRRWGYMALVLLGFTLALATVADRRSVLQDAHIHSSGRPYRATFTLKDDAAVRVTSKGDTLVTFNGEIRSLRIKVNAYLPPGTAPPKAGETWQCNGWLSNWNEWDALRRREMRVRGKLASLLRLDDASARWSLERMLHILREDTARRIRIGLEQNEHGANLLVAMLLGKRSKMDGRDRKTFVDAGAMHVFAISGLHVMVLARIFVLLGTLAMLPYRFAGILAIPLIWLYVLMAGAPPSAVRAGGMVSICLAAPMFWRRKDSIVAWAMSFIAAHIMNPSQIMDAGSGLSFVVMLALVILIRMDRGENKHPVVNTIIFSSVAWAAALPISARVFGRIALAGLVSGPIVIPAATCATVCCAIGILASFISPHLAAYPNACAALAMRFMYAISSLVAQIPCANIETAPWTLGECLAWYVAMAAAFWLAMATRTRRTTTI